MNQSFGYLPQNERKKILLICDDIRVHSGVATIARELVINTAQHFNWVNVGGAINHPEAGKRLDLSADTNTNTGLTDSSVTLYPSILYKGYLDLVLYNEDTDKHKIIDFKTSTRGWNADTKKDEGKQFQLLFYKEYYSKQYNVDKDNIDVEFIILKRKIWEESEFPQSRIQEFAPPDGKIKMNRAMGSMGNFIEQCFNNDGSFKDTNHPITPNKNCQWCPFNNNKELCNK